MNQQGVQPVSGWQGMTPQLQSGDPTQAILDSQTGNGQYAVDKSPTTNIQAGGSPNASTMASLAMLAMMA